jgi:putative alpha-1,2-mannosidase
MLAVLLCLRPLSAKEAVDYLDPFIGTGHEGKDFPGATVPFSMVKLSPDCGGSISYHYDSKYIQGFSFTHLGGADGGELGNLLVTPTTGPLQTFWRGGNGGHGYSSAFSKSSEQASAGYYAVTLDDPKTRAEMTALRG